MRTNRRVSAGLDLIAERIKQHSNMGRFLDDLDRLDRLVGSENGKEQNAPVNRPYSGEELATTDRWK